MPSCFVGRRREWNRGLVAREYGRIKTAIWDDEDFLSLSLGAQWLYELILTQRELNLCGVIRPAFGRWASFSSGTPVRSVRKFAGELTEAKFILTDEDWDELLARTFVRHDLELKSPNVVVGMSQAFDSTHSSLLRNTIICELSKVAHEGLMPTLLRPIPDGETKPLRNRLAKGFLKAWENR